MFLECEEHCSTHFLLYICTYVFRIDKQNSHFGACILSCICKVRYYNKDNNLIDIIYRVFPKNGSFGYLCTV